MIRGLLIYFFTLTCVFASDYTFLLIPSSPQQLDSKELYGHFAINPDPHTIILPLTKWHMSGVSPAGLIKRFRDTIKAGTNVEKLNEEMHRMVDMKSNKNRIPDHPFHPDHKPSKGNTVVFSTIQWSGIYFLIEKDNFVTFGEVEGGYVVCTRNKAGFIVKQKRGQGATEQPTTTHSTK